MERSRSQCNTITDGQPDRGRIRGHSTGNERGTRQKQSRRWGSSVWLWLLLALPAAPSGAVKIERMSPPPLDLEVSLPGTSPSISADGRFVAFVVEDRDIFVRDRQSGMTELVSASSNGESADASSFDAAISGHGRFVAFGSAANNLVPGDTNNQPDIFVRDRQTGKTELVSVSSSGARANGWSDSPAISADGGFVAFVSYATNLVPGDTNGQRDVFVRDRQTGKTEGVSVSGSGVPANRYNSSPAISADGRFVAFVSSASNLAPDDMNTAVDILLWDRQTGKTEWVGFTTNINDIGLWFRAPAISADGRFVAFGSRTNNLVPGDTNNGWDLFVRDRQIGKTELVSVTTSGAPAGGSSFLQSSPSISADGRFVAFRSGADDLVPGEWNGEWNIYVRDRQSSKTELVSVGTSGTLANGRSFDPVISGDGRFVAFGSSASNLVPGDTNGAADAFLRDRITATTEVITVSVNVGRTPLDSSQPAISADGQWVAFVTAGQVFARNRITKAAALVSATAGGAPAHGSSSFPSISGDGRFVAFGSLADNLVPGDINGYRRVFVRDRQTGKMELVSVGADGAPANGDSSYDGASPAISGDGRFVAFWSDADNLVPGDTNHADDIFVHDRQTGKTERVSIAANGAPANGYSHSPSISADGRFVVFGSTASNLAPGDTNHAPDIFVRDRQTGTTELVSVAANGVPADGQSASPSISADGRFIAFWSQATNLVPGDTRGGVFVRDRQSGKTERVADGYSPSISADGRFVAFEYGGIFVRDRQTGKTELVSVNASGMPANGHNYSPGISADGRFVAFWSDADNLVPGDTNGKADVFVAERE